MHTGGGKGLYVCIGARCEPQCDIDDADVLGTTGIFQRLVEDELHVQHNILLVTGCGFPDLPTRCVNAAVALV